MTDLFKAGVNLLGAGIVLKLVKDMGDNLTEEKKKHTKVECKKRKSFPRV